MRPTRARVLAGAALFGCSLFAPPAVLGQQESIVLRIAGDDLTATTIVPPITKRFLETRGASGVKSVPPPPGWTQKISGSLLGGGSIGVLIRASNSTEGLRYLRDGRADIATTGRAIYPSEARDLAKLGDMASPQAADLVAHAGVVITALKTTVERIDFEDLRAVYAGRIRDWSQLGAPGGPIHPLARAPGSATRDLFDRVVMGPLPYGSNVRFFSTFQAMHEAVTRDPAALCYTPVGQTAGLTSILLRASGHVTAHPDLYGLTSGDYPLRVQLTLYHAPQPKVNAVAIAEFIHEANSVSTETDLMFLDLSRVDTQLLIPETDASDPPAYRKLASSGLRVSTTIHFRPGSLAIESSQVDDLDRLATYLRFLQVPNDELRFVAFCDENGSSAKNASVSRRLGTVVVEELRKRRVNASAVTALGATAPLASDFTSEGRFLNRRVETWILP